MTTDSARFIRRKPLDHETSASIRGLEVEASIAALSRIHSYWAAFTQSPYFFFPIDDRGLYSLIRHDLVFLLGNHAGLQAVEQEVIDLVPDFEPGFDCPSEVTADIMACLHTARSILYNVLASEGRMLGPSPAEDIFSLFDDEIDWLREQVRSEVERGMQVYGLGPARRQPESLSPSPNNQGTPTNKRGGRKPIDLSYEVAQAAYWDVYEDLEQQEGGARSPSQQDVCDRLKFNGTHVGVTTFGKRIQEWREDGRDWPPPQPKVGLTPFSTSTV